jgi:hypothetical protein
MRLRDWAFVFTAAVLLVQAGCNRGGNPDPSGGGNNATSNPSAAIPGTSGKGTDVAGSRSQTPPPGSGLGGGLGMSGSFPSGTATQSSGGGATDGSTNRKPGSGATQ